MSVKQHPRPLHRPQRGLVLVLALIVLVALSLAAVGMMRGVFGSNRVAGNLAAQQATVQAGDIGIARAIAWLEQQAAATAPLPASAASGAKADKLNSLYNSITQGAMRYSATRTEPGAGQSWAAFWGTLQTAGLVNNIAADANGNQVSYVIQRLCSATGDPVAARCEASPSQASGQGNSVSNTAGIAALSQTYYRITVRVQGPRNATSFIQAVVAI